MAEKLIIRNTQSPGDVVVLTAMIRDLHRAYPGRYETAASTAPGAEHVYYENPLITQIAGRRRPKGYEQFVARYPLIHRSNQQRKHFMWGFIEYINKQRNLNVKLTEFKPDLYLSEAEKAVPPVEPPYWVFLSGGKKDFTLKIWAQSCWQQVISATRDRIRWVQCGGGSRNHIRHIPKAGIHANLIGRTDLRKFICLVYHADGVACVVTAAMHIAAAFNKPCVVVAGGREPPWWEEYTKENRLANMRVASPDWEPPAGDDFIEHKYLHTIGRLPCCKTGGCWKGRLTGGNRCRMPVQQNGETVPKCKAMITPDMVIDAIYDYYRDGVISQPKLAVPGGLDNVTFGIFAGRAPDGWVEEMRRQVSDPAVFDNGSRVQAIKEALDLGREWLVWIEPGVDLSPGWKRQLRLQLREPGVYGRIYRTAGGKLCPHPGFFAAHRECVAAARTFVELFTAPADRFRRLGAYVDIPVGPGRLNWKY